jgi:ferrous iron transport protein A
MQPGTSAWIREVNGVGPLRRRLLEMGVLPGTRLKVERVAPLGDPIEVRVRGYALSLRRNEAAHIRVDPAA